MEIIFIGKEIVRNPSIATLKYGECVLLDQDKSSVYMRVQTNQKYVEIKSLVPAPTRGGLIKMLNLSTGEFACLSPMTTGLPVKVSLQVQTK